jgi:hypothetical protein
MWLAIRHEPPPLDRPIISAGFPEGKKISQTLIRHRPLEAVAPDRNIFSAEERPRIVAGERAGPRID